jgi:hypothetical protein
VLIDWCCCQVLAVLPAIVPVLLESLSNFEDARLNYIEQVGGRGGGTGAGCCRGSA